MTVSNRLLKVILVASIALNLAFLSVFISRSILQPDKKKNSHPPFTLKTNLSLNPDQKEKIEKIIKKFKVNLLKYKENALDKRISIIEAMSEQDFDPEIVEEKTRQLNQLEGELNLLFVNALMEINVLLEPSQRLDFLYRLSRNWFFLERKHPEKERRIP